ncbi:MAG TPA: glycosyltransferase family 2 protein [Myxococcota bacterium]|nr:glycosyltransferase family 2 protein [Myxococcota bacterium]
MTINCHKVTPAGDRRKVFDRRVAILIPAYNEMAHIDALIDACRAVEPAIILVVDDCSADATPTLLERQVQRATKGVVLRALRTGRNLGKQGAVLKGLSVLGDYDFDALALIDGDGQHDPAELPDLVALIDDYDFVIGARSQEQMPIQRRLSNWLVNLGFSLIGGVDFTDVQSGLRVYSRELADALACRLGEEGGYALEHESLTALSSYSRERGRDLLAAAAPISCAYGRAASSISAWHVLQLAYETVHQAMRLRRSCEARATG